MTLEGARARGEKLRARSDSATTKDPVLSSQSGPGGWLMIVTQSNHWIRVGAATMALLLCQACGHGADRSKHAHDAGSDVVALPHDSGAPDGSETHYPPLKWGLDAGLLPDNVEPQRIPLPPRPAWNPAIPLGSPGWKKSNVPFCSEDVAMLSPRVWANSAAVYVTVSSSCFEVLDSPPITCNWDPVQGGSGALTVYKNDGTGWKRIYRHAAGGGGPMQQWIDGRLVIPLSDCPQALIADDGTATCIWTGSGTFAPMDASVTPGGNLFVLGMDGPSPYVFQVWKYDGVTWTNTKTWNEGLSYPLSSPVRLVNGFLVEKDDGGVLWVGDPAQPSQLTPISGVPFLAGQPEWTYGTTDVLLSNPAGGLAHYDASQWMLTEPVFGTLDAQAYATYIVQMWGAPDRSVFMRSDGIVGFGRWRAGTPFQIISTGLGISDFWGTTSTEVFLAAGDRAFNDYACGNLSLLWYDGVVFHEF